MDVDPVLETVIIPNGPPVVSPVPAVSLADAEIKVGVVCMNVDPVIMGYDRIIIPEPPAPPASG
jgi:hypothetical protein